MYFIVTGLLLGNSVAGEINKNASFCTSVKFDLREKYEEVGHAVLHDPNVPGMVDRLLHSWKAHIVTKQDITYDCQLTIEIIGRPIAGFYDQTARDIPRPTKLYSGADVSLVLTWRGPATYSKQVRLNGTVSPPQKIPLGYDSLPSRPEQAPFAEAVVKAGFDYELKMIVQEGMRTVR